MAKQLDDTKVQMGTFIKVENLERKHIAEKHVYYALKVEDWNGDNDRWMLFTEKELKKFHPCVLMTSATVSKAGKIVAKVRVGNLVCNIMLLKNMPGGKDGIYSVGDKALNRGLMRARKNQEDIPTESWLKRLFG